MYKIKEVSERIKVNFLKVCLTCAVDGGVAAAALPASLAIAV